MQKGVWMILGWKENIYHCPLRWMELNGDKQPWQETYNEIVLQMILAQMWFAQSKLSQNVTFDLENLCYT